MQTLASWSLRTKLWLSLGGLFLVLLLGTVISAVVLTRFSHELQRLLRENYDSEVFCAQMINALDRLDASARQLAWDETGDAIDADAQKKIFTDNLTFQTHNVTLPGELETTQRLADDWQSFTREYDRLAHAARGQRQKLYVQTLLPIFRDARASAQQVAALNMSNVVSADGRVRAKMIEVRDILLVLAAIGALLAITVVGATGATLLQQLRDLTRSALKIGAGELDLTVTVPSRDEVGQLAEAFNVMAGRLRDYRKIDHERLLRAQHTTQLAIDSLPDAVMVASPDGCVEIANRTARAHFHAEPGSHLADLNVEWLVALHHRVARGEHVEPQGYSSAIQLFDAGHERFLLPRGMPMFDGPRIVGVAIILADVTRLRRADEFKSSLVSMVSHELRTPLTSMRMSTLLLADKTLGPLLPKQLKLVEAARDESERLYQIIENMLNFSRAQVGVGALRTQIVPVLKLVTDALAPLQAAFDEKEIKIEVSVDQSPAVKADPTLAASILTNLLSNALKFTPPHGHVSISSETRANIVAISVADTGPGIPPEHAAKLFKRFFRAPGTDKTPGTGLGLAIAREIVEAHDGTLTYQPNPTGGSIFRFTLPMEDPRSP